LILPVDSTEAREEGGACLLLSSLHLFPSELSKRAVQTQALLSSIKMTIAEPPQERFNLPKTYVERLETAYFNLD
jgi:hypothetical protein